jgi:hypothetical protein
VRSECAYRHALVVDTNVQHTPLEPTPWCTSEQPVRCPGVLSVRTPPTAFLFAHLPFVVVQRAPADTVAFHILQAGKRTTVHAPSMRSDVVGAKSKGRLKSVPHTPVCQMAVGCKARVNWRSL